MFDSSIIPPHFLDFQNHSWVVQTLEQLTLEEKIAQLIHIPSWSNRGEDHIREVESMVKDYGIGGICFFQGTTKAQKTQTEHYQALSKVPILISQDAEWGLAMRLSDCEPFPYAMTLGATDDEKLVYEIAKHIGEECRDLGVHINFAPVVDVNTNPENPVIGFRSFGDNSVDVGNFGAAFARGLAERGVVAVMKHFPGHGDTAVDSHLGLPVLPHTKKRLGEVELAPFAKLTSMGIPAVMSSHLHVPIWDDEENRSVTHSLIIIQQQLREYLSYHGLLFTDALDMQGVRNYGKPADINLKALLAGHDALLFCVDVHGTIDLIKQAIDQGQISMQEIDRRCRRVLAAKYFYIIQKKDLDPFEWEKDSLLHQVAEKSLSWIKGQASDLPRPDDEKALFVLMDIEQTDQSELAHHQLTLTGKLSKEYEILSLLPPQAHQVVLNGRVDEITWKGELTKITSADRVILYIHGIHLKARNQFGIDEQINRRLKEVCDSKEVHVIIPASPYSMTYMEALDMVQSILLAYQPQTFMLKGILEKIGWLA